MTDNEIIELLNECDTTHIKIQCVESILSDTRDVIHLDLSKIVDILNRQKAEIERLEHLLLGVMHFVDKWLDGAELKQDEVNRARAMREKTLQIVEKLEEENDFLKSIDIDKIKAEAVKEFEERAIKNICEKVYAPTPVQSCIVEKCNQVIIEIAKEMVGADGD